VLQKAGVPLPGLSRGSEAARPSRAAHEGGPAHRQPSRGSDALSGSHGTSMCPGWRRASSTGTAVHGRTRPRRLALQSQQAAARSLCEVVGRALTWADELYGYTVGDPRGDLAFDDRDSAPFAPLARWPTAPSIGAARAVPPRGARPVIYEAHVRGMDPAASGGSRGAARRLCGAGLGTRHPAPAKTGGGTLQADARALLPNDRTCTIRGFATTGIQHLGFFAPQPSYPRIPRRRAMWCANSSRWSRICTRRIRGDPGRRVQHTPREPRGPTLSFAASTTVVLPRGAADARHYMDFTGWGTRST